MPKCDFSKAALQLYSNHTSARVFSCKFAVYFRTPFSKNTYGRLLLTEGMTFPHSFFHIFRKDDCQVE